jgi:hypothetical protein
VPTQVGSLTMGRETAWPPTTRPRRTDAIAVCSSL